MLSYLTGADGVAMLIQLLVVVGAVAVAVGLARRIPPPPPDGPARGAHRKLRALAIIAGIMAFGWVVQVTVLAYWQSQMPD